MSSGFSVFVLLVLLRAFVVAAEMPNAAAPRLAGRERLLLDAGWRFAFGHPFDAEKDFGTGTGYFSYLAKTGYGDGAASPDFDDRAWRTLDVPHDWAVEVPFDNRGGHSHGYKAIGRNFPDSSVGWYRKRFHVPSTDLGRRISLEFDGVFRDSVVWVNGHYLGREPSGYMGFAYNIGEFLNYGGDNVIAVRADATMEEGWFYEGAGIYRHVWLVKTDPLHVERHGQSITTKLGTDSAVAAIRTGIANEGLGEAAFEIEHSILDDAGAVLARERMPGARLDAWDRGEYVATITLDRPKLWSIETPHLHRLVTVLRKDGVEVDRCETRFGVRSIRFDPDSGFFLNGRRVQLKGSNNHQDHAGVGAALPDALQEYRIGRLKDFGCNAYRCSHNPPTPELLDACDRLGMVVIDEHRMMGTSEPELGYLRRLIERDRNHPSVILWSLGNEEWAIEGNEKGERITATMQAFANRLDATRPCTIASSGGWGNGSSKSIAVMGYNYISHGSTDEQHRKFPRQAGVGTEETTTQGTRGVYFDDRPRAHMAAVDKGDSGGNCERGWKHYAERPYLAGLFYWTGFDYRGESTPFGYPAISSQFGILDTCGFPKDSFYYLKAWWTDEPLVHVAMHWNWPGKEGQELDVKCYSNCEEIELCLNNRSLGRKTMERNGHLKWRVAWEPGTLLARGYNQGREVAQDRAETTGQPAVVLLSADRAAIQADGQDVAVVTVEAVDAQGRSVPVADNEIRFHVQGPGRIIGVGNGDPSCHEPDRYFESVTPIPVERWRRGVVGALENLAETGAEFDDSSWPETFAERDQVRRGDGSRQSLTNIYRGVFQLAADTNYSTATILLRKLGERQWVYINGSPATPPEAQPTDSLEMPLDMALLRPGTNVVAIVAEPLQETRGGGRREGGGSPATLKLTAAPGQWKRSLFNGLAQVIVQSTPQSGEIVLIAESSGLKPCTLRVQAKR